MEYTTENDWTSFVNVMKQKIAEYVKGDIANWIEPDFTTTELRDRAVSNVILMGALKEYFAYTFVLGCGLSKVTLEGTLDDWEKLVEKARYLYNFKNNDMNSWADLLIPVLEQFVSAYSGQVSEDFWQRICTSSSYGSGSQQEFKGWFLVFSPFNKKGKYILRPKPKVDADHIYSQVSEDDIIDCQIDVPVTIIDMNDGGKRYETTFYAGMMTTRYNEETNTLRPGVDWAIVINKELTFDDMKDYLDTLFTTYSYSTPNDEVKASIRWLLPFAYHAAKNFNFPQDSLLELVDAIYKYYNVHCVNWKHPSRLSEDEIYSGFLKFKIVVISRDVTSANMLLQNVSTRLSIVT